MEIRDGFIESVFNYCDRWCETCALASHCRLFSDMAKADAAQDANMAAVVHAPPLPAELPPPPPEWLQRLIEEMNEAASEPLTDDQLAPFGRKLPSQHEMLHERAMAYGIWVHKWREQGNHADTRSEITDPVAVIAWFATLNASKIYRALTGLADFDGDREFPPDHEGSAKVALIGIDRSQGAWRQLASSGRIDQSVGRTCVDELEWIKTQLERAIPLARAFVRPGFDEPEAFARLQLASH